MILALSTLLLTLLTLPGCFPALKKKARAPEEALSQVRFFYPAFRDDMETDSLITATERSIAYLNRLSPEKIFHYGAHRFTCRQVLESQKTFLKLISDNPGPDKLNRSMRKHFRVYRATGRVGNRKVLFTGYFSKAEASSQGSKTKKSCPTIPNTILMKKRPLRGATWRLPG
jgi:membrane-bound lytic murein transglycosylase A